MKEDPRSPDLSEINAWLSPFFILRGTPVLRLLAETSVIVLSLSFLCPVRPTNALWAQFWAPQSLQKRREKGTQNY